MNILEKNQYDKNEPIAEDDDVNIGEDDDADDDYMSKGEPDADEEEEEEEEEDAPLNEEDEDDEGEGVDMGDADDDEDDEGGPKEDQAQSGKRGRKKRVEEVAEVEDDDVEEEGNAFPETDIDAEAVIVKQHPNLMVEDHQTIRMKLPQKGPGDEYHRTPPIISKYEKTQVLGYRINQLVNGCPPYIDIPQTQQRPETIAQKEFETHSLPYILCRPRGDGATEYWRIKDLRIL